MDACEAGNNWLRAKRERERAEVALLQLKKNEKEAKELYKTASKAHAEECYNRNVELRRKRLGY